MQNNSEILEPPQLAEFALRLAPGELGRVEYLPVKLTNIEGIRMNDVELVAVASTAEYAESHTDWDCVVWVRGESEATGVEWLDLAFNTLINVDQTASTNVTLMPNARAAGGRIVVSSTGPLLRDQDDVRRFADAGRKGLARALQAGSSRPLLLLSGVPADARYSGALPVTVLGALDAAWQPLEARLAAPDSANQLTRLGVCPIKGEQRTLAAWIEWLSAVDSGRRLARDLCGTEPERMAPVPFAEYCREVLTDSGLTMDVKLAGDNLAQEYPLLCAVARASMSVPRHHPAVMRIEYHPDEPPTKTILLAGKGVTFDTGGADLKVGGAMAGMSRDKGGAAAAAGIMRAISRLRPKGVRVIAELGLVRNSIGSNSFVPDEILTSHAGTRVRIGNTDAEGRLVLADLLSHLREDAQNTRDANLFSIATLTGHAARSIGPYTSLLDNAPARAQGVSALLEASGDRFGDPFDPQRLRPEDWDFVAPGSAAEDVLSSNNAPSAITVRGHQFPAAFLAIASGLDKHGANSERPLAYTHVDIAGSAVTNGWQAGTPSARPMVGMLTGVFSDLLPD